MGAFKNCRLYVAQYDLTTDFNQIALNLGAEGLANTRFQPPGTLGAKVEEPGLATVEMSGRCFVEADSEDPQVEDVLTSKLAVANVPVSVIPLGGVAGDIAWFFRALLANYAPSGQVGELLVAEVNAKASGGEGAVRGLVLETGIKNASGQGAGQQLGAVAEGKRFFAALHAFNVTGGTLTVKVESDADNGFGSATERLTFTPLTEAGSEWKEVSGPISDTYWRVTWTLSGGSATLALVAGIL